jgi:glycosyltransferase involved in cell wall biosynthesis
MPTVFSFNPNAHLFIVGSGTRYYESKLRGVVEELNLATNVTFTGFLNGEAKWSAMAAADMFVLPSRQENFGIAIAEAMHAGLPVIVSRDVNISPAIAAASAGAVLDNAKDTEMLANRICRLIDDPAAMRRAGNNARELALKMYSWSTAAERYFALYDAVLKDNSVRPYQ